jgi:hypothetical protein
MARHPAPTGDPAVIDPMDTPGTERRWHVNAHVRRHRGEEIVVPAEDRLQLPDGTITRDWQPPAETGRARTIFDLLRRVSEIADTKEDVRALRALIEQARVAPNMHVGTPPEQFSKLTTAEWILGQWADMIDNQ